MSNEPPAPVTPDVKDVTQALFAQIMRVMGLEHPNLATRCLHPIFKGPILRLSRMLVELDGNIADRGWNAAVSQFMTYLVTRLELNGEDNIPRTGPIMVICNHPAALDVGILAAAIRREDLKILISDIPIVQMFPNISQHCIPVYYDIPRRLQTVRSAIHHLQQDGALFFFPRGNVEPDPAVSPGAEQSLERWSSSAEMFLRQVPTTLTVVTIAHGMLSAGWYKNPLVSIWKKYEQRQKVAEIFQIAAQLVTGKTPSATPTVTFSSPVSISDLGGEAAPDGAWMRALVDRARSMLLDFRHS